MQRRPAGRRVIVHVDMDAFYASVEVLLDPSLAGKPVIVGGSGARGVVASCSYEARAYGVRSAMPSVQARRLCPEAVFLSGRFSAYNDYSARIRSIFESFTPIVEPIALDEAFLDVTGAARLLGDGAEIGAEIRTRVYDELGLSCSVGVAACKLLAKLASEAAKPLPPTLSPGGRIRTAPVGDRALVGATRSAPGVVVVVAGDELGFLHPQPVRALWGVGPATFKRLSAYGVTTIGDLAALPLATAVRALGESAGRHLHALAWGIDERPVESERAVKSIGHEETFAADHHELDTLTREVLRLSDSVASRLRRAGVVGRTVQLKLRYSDFRTITRSRTLATPVDNDAVIAATANELLAAPDVSAEIATFGVRLLGVSMANLIAPHEAAGTGAEQLDLFAPPERNERPRVSVTAPSRRSGGAGTEATTSPPDSKASVETKPAPAAKPALDAKARASLDAVVDAVRARFGDSAMGRAALLTTVGGSAKARSRLRVKQIGDTQWGPDATDGATPDITGDATGEGPT